MADSTVGTDAWFDEAHPKRNHSSGDVVRVKAGAGVRRRIGLHLPIREIRGRTVTTAWLTVRARDSNPSQTITVRMPADGWSSDSVNWDNQPSWVSGVSGSAAIAALDEDESATIPITTILQAVADGAKWRGLVLESNGAAAFWSFDSGRPSFEIHYELSNAPTTPTDLRPDGGVCSSGKPTLGWSNVDLGGDSSEQAQFEVQIDPTGAFTSPWSSGVLTSTEPELDLTATAYAGLASGSATQWRVRTIDSNAVSSDWSDPAVFTYRPKRTFVFDSPTGGTIGDPTPEVIGHLSAGTLTKYRLFVTAGGDRSNVLYDSGRRNPDGSTVSTSVPWRDPEDRKRIIRRDDVDYQIGVRAWDEYPRVASAGDPTYTETWVTVTFDEDSHEPPAAFTVTQAIPGDPRLTFSFTRSEAPETLLITTIGDDGESHLYARVDLDDLTIPSPGHYQWRDRGQTAPYDPTTFRARVIDAGHRSHAADPVTATVKPIGVWLIPDDESIAPIRMRGRGVGSFKRVDRRASYQPLHVDAPVDVVYGRNGISGDWAGTIDTNQPTTGNVLAAVRRLEAVFDNAGARPQLVWATKSIEVEVSAATVVPADEFVDSSRIHNVSFHFEEQP